MVPVGDAPASSEGNPEWPEAAFSSAPGKPQRCRKKGREPHPFNSAGYQKYRKRLQLQRTPYAALGEEEKEKDRVVAEVRGAGWIEWTFHESRLHPPQVVVNHYLTGLGDARKDAGITIQRTDEAIWRRMEQLGLIVPSA